MVNSKIQKRRQREYDLDRIRELAKSGKVAYGSRDVEKDIENLSYEPVNVHECLAELEDKHYKETINYGDHKGWLDVYHTTYQSPTGHQDDLYIKLKLNKNCVMIVLASFHRHGAL